MAYKLTTVGPIKYGFGEAPLWDSRLQRLLFVDCFAKTLNQYNPKTGENEGKTIPGLESVPYLIVGVPYENSSKFLVGGYDKLVEFDWYKDLESRVLYEFKSQDSGEKKIVTCTSDAKCDASGRFWMGTYVPNNISDLSVMSNAGNLARFDLQKDGSILESTQASGYDAPNGLTWNLDYTKLFHCDLIQKVIRVYDFDLANGNAENPRTFFDMKNNVDGYADGLTADCNGNLWLACWKGSCVVKIDGTTGQVLDKVTLPVENVTSVIFGDEKYNTLYVTTTSRELDKSEVKGQPEAGKLFSITCEKDNSFRGFPTGCFK